MKFIKEFKEKMSEVIQDFSDVYIDNICESFGEKLSGKLNSGSFGTAYRTKSGKILKITSDGVEASNSYQLIGGNYKHIIKTYDVKEVILESDNNSVKIYAILMEYVRPLSNIEKEVFGIIRLHFFNKSQDLMNRRGNLVTYLSYKYDKKEILDALYKFIKSKDSMLEEGYELGLSFKEAHISNLGWDKKGNLVYFDLGWNESVELSDTINIEKIFISDRYKDLMDVIRSNFNVNEKIPLRKLVKLISNKMNVTLSKSYKMLRDNVYNEYFIKSGLKDEYRTLAIRDYIDTRMETLKNMNKYFILNDDKMVDLYDVSKEDLKDVYFVFN